MLSNFSFGVLILILLKTRSGSCILPVVKASVRGSRAMGVCSFNVHSGMCVLSRLIFKTFVCDFDIMLLGISCSGQDVTEME